MSKIIAKLLKMGFTKAKAMQMAKQFYHLPSTVLGNRVLFPKLAKTLSPLKQEFTEGYKVARNVKPKINQIFKHKSAMPGYQKAFTGYIDASKKNLKKQLLTDKSFDKFVRNIKEGYKEEMKFFDINFSNLHQYGPQDRKLALRSLWNIWGNHWSRNINKTIPSSKVEKFKKLWDADPNRAREFIRNDMFTPYLDKLKDPVKLRKLYNTNVNSSIDMTPIRFEKIKRKSTGTWKPVVPMKGHSITERAHFMKNPTGWISVDPSKLRKGNWTTLVHELKHGVQGDLGYRLFPSVMNNSQSIRQAPLARGANRLLQKANLNVKKGFRDFHKGWFTRGSEKSSVLSEYRSFSPYAQSLIRKLPFPLPLSRGILKMKSGGSIMFGGAKQLKAADKIVFGAVPPGLLGVSVKEEKR
jgi:hypothetical protein